MLTHPDVISQDHLTQSGHRHWWEKLNWPLDDPDETQQQIWDGGEQICQREIITESRMNELQPIISIEEIGLLQKTLHTHRQTELLYWIVHMLYWVSILWDNLIQFLTEDLWCADEIPPDPDVSCWDKHCTPSLQYTNTKNISACVCVDQR